MRNKHWNRKVSSSPLGKANNASSERWENWMESVGMRSELASVRRTAAMWDNVFIDSGNKCIACRNRTFNCLEGNPTLWIAATVTNVRVHPIAIHPSAIEILLHLLISNYFSHCLSVFVAVSSREWIILSFANSSRSMSDSVCLSSAMHVSGDFRYILFRFALPKK